MVTRSAFEMHNNDLLKIIIAELKHIERMDLIIKDDFEIQPFENQTHSSRSILLKINIRNQF